MTTSGSHERRICLDTETTGFDPATGDRIVEVGCVELMGMEITGNNFHRYLNPERAMSPGAFKVHGLGDDFLASKPLFADIADDLRNYLADDCLIIHNAAFDMKFLNAELKTCGAKALTANEVIDTLAMARKQRPGRPAKLDDLIRAFNIDGSARTLHGALMDASLLAEVYIELCGGRQMHMALEEKHEKKSAGLAASKGGTIAGYGVNQTELSDHTDFLADLRADSWT